MDNCFPRRLRLLQTDDFRRLFRSARRIRDRHFFVLSDDNPLEHARLGVITAKKNIPRAVDRNRVRRLIREVFRKNQSDLNGLDIVFNAQRTASQLTNRDLIQCLEQLLQKLRRDFR